MVVSGVRSSWLASATKRRIRSSDRLAVASEAARARNAASIWASVLLNARPSRPTSVRGSRSGTRRARSPAAMAPAVCSISARGRRLARTIAAPRPASASSTSALAIRSMRSSRPMVPSISSRLAATTTQPAPSRSGSTRTRQRTPPEVAGTVKAAPARASSSAASVGSRGDCCPSWNGALSSFSRLPEAVRTWIRKALGGRMPLSWFSPRGGPSGRPWATPRTAPAATPLSWSSRRPTREPRSAAMLARLISASVTVTSASTAAISLTRSGVRASSRPAADHGRAAAAATGFDPTRAISGRLLAVGEPQHVPDAADGVDQPRFDRVDLAAQVRHVRLDDAAVALEVVVPHVVEDLSLRQHPPDVVHQVAQQLELGRRQLDAAAGAPHLVALFVQLQVGDPQPDRGRRRHPCAGAAEHRPDAGEHLLEAERLGDVVVAADRQPGHLVLGGVPRRQEQHRGSRAARPEPAGHVEAVQVGQHHVEDDQVRAVSLGGLQGLEAARGGCDLEAGEPQAGRQQLQDVGLVLDHQQPGLRLLTHGRLPWDRASSVVTIVPCWHAPRAPRPATRRPRWSAALLGGACAFPGSSLGTAAASGHRVVEAEAVGGGGRLGAAVDAQLGEDVADVDAGRLAADEQRLGDLAVGAARRH